MKFKFSQYCINVSEDSDKYVLYNTVTGGIIKLEKGIYDRFKQRFFEEKEINFFDDLRKEHFVVPECQDEFQLIRHNEINLQQNIASVDTLSYVIAPTTACNLRCIYCFEHEQDCIATMDGDTIAQTIKFIDREMQTIKNVNKVYVTWFGGEPLLCFNQMLEFGEKFRQQFNSSAILLDSRVITNGVLLTQEKARLLKEKVNVTAAQITIDGTCEEYCRKKKATASEFNKLLDNVKDVSEILNVCVRLNVDKDNLEDIYKLVDILCDEFGLCNKVKLYFAMLRDYTGGQNKSIHFFTLNEYAIEKRMFYTYLASKGFKNQEIKFSTPCHKPIFCGLSRIKNFAVGPTGELYKCEHHFGQKDKVIGDIYNGVYYNNIYFDHISGVKDEHCEKCELYPICQTNCPEIHRLVKFADGKCSRYFEVMDRLKSSVASYLESKQ